ncbi:MAG: hypothetical protein AB7G80_05055 [Dongiaceae bacterium]
MFDDIQRRIFNSIGATQEAINSQLPGRIDGPADAYRHILGAAKLTYQIGPVAAQPILDSHESTGHIKGQNEAAERMDKYNNSIGAIIGIEAIQNNWDEEKIKEEVQKVFTDLETQKKYGKPTWLPKGEWDKNPVYDENGITPPGKAGSPMPVEHTNWPPDFSRPNRNNPYHPDYDPAAKRSESGLEKDIHPALRGIDIETGEKFSEMPLRKHLERRFDLKEKYQGKKGANGPVFVRAHSREGGKIHVDSYTRQPPEGGSNMN